MELLRAPKSGRSRFSKALPAPPPELEDDRLQTASRDSPASLHTLFPPRKDSFSAKSIASPSVKSSLNSPLPALPSANTMGVSQLQTQARTIPRKPVGLPSNPAPAPAPVPPPVPVDDAQVKKMRRVSSISSLLSAYSNTSSDSVQRSSQGSIFTKDSEPSNSPEREGMNDAQQSLTKTLSGLPSNPYKSELPSITDEVIAVDLPPPPPLKDITRPGTPTRTRPADLSSPPRPDVFDGSPSASPPSIGGESPQRREIWRRRASSKSDRSLLVPELKLAGSHGSTAATAQPVNPELPPPPSLQNNNTTSPLPPRNASLPGRNVRPIKQAEPQPESEMRKFSSKLRELAGRGEATKDSEEAKDKPIEKRQESEPKVQPQTEANAIPVRPTADQHPAEESTDIPKISIETVLHAPIGSVQPSEPPPKESAEKPISRRPVGTLASQNQPEVHKKGSSSDLRMQGLGLPRYPRASQSNPSLRSPPGLPNAQEAMRPRAAPQPGPSTTMPLTLPADSKEPLRKPELFNIVTALNEPNLSLESANARKPTRKISRDVDATALSDIGESVEHMTPEQTAQINEALSRFPRNVNYGNPSTDSVWRAPPVSSRHYNCYVRHVKWVPVKNLNYALACQTCGIEDTSPRKTCSWCNLRICFKCQERLMGPYKADLKVLMENMEADKRREKGKQPEST